MIAAVIRRQKSFDTLKKSRAGYHQKKIDNALIYKPQM
jgi:hypothetical protein